MLLARDYPLAIKLNLESPKQEYKINARHSTIYIYDRPRDIVKATISPNWVDIIFSVKGLRPPSGTKVWLLGESESEEYPIETPIEAFASRSDILDQVKSDIGSVLTGWLNDVLLDYAIDKGYNFNDVIAEKIIELDNTNRISFDIFDSYFWLKEVTLP